MCALQGKRPARARPAQFVPRAEAGICQATGQNQEMLSGSSNSHFVVWLRRQAHRTLRSGLNPGLINPPEGAVEEAEGQNENCWSGSVQHAG